VFLATTFVALPAHAFDWAKFDTKKWTENTYRLISLLGNGVGRLMKGVCGANVRAEAPEKFLALCGPQLATWYGDSYELVSATPVQCADGRWVYNVICRDANAASSIQAALVLEYTGAGLLESLTFDRDLMVSPDVSIKRGVPVPVETVMRALRVGRSVTAAETDGLVIKKVKTKLSMKKPDAEQLRGIHMIRGSAPTAHTDFNSVSNITIGAFDPAETARVFNTFSCSTEGVYGRDNDKYAASFLLAPELGWERPVAQFKARLRKGRVLFAYRYWYVNPQTVLVDQVSYEAARGVLKTNPPIKTITVSGVHFAMDNEVHEVDDIPMLLKVQKSGARMRSVKLLNPLQ
jgi:hypothetical protein